MYLGIGGIIAGIVSALLAVYFTGSEASKEKEEKGGITSIGSIGASGCASLLLVVGGVFIFLGNKAGS